MTDIFDFEQRTDDYAVMGNPVSHSLSPRIHTLFAEQTQQKMQYTAIQVDTGGFKQAVGNFNANGGKGLNITVPFKQEAFALVDIKSDRAERAGAVNTISFVDEQLHGDNTDGVGLVNDLDNNCKLVLRNKRILLMGAGGAARGVVAPLLNEQPSELVIVNRTAEKAVDLAEAFNDIGKVRGCGYDELAGLKFDLIINATAASLNNDLPPLPSNIVNDEGACYDMMYGKQTPFMNWARGQGVQYVYDGLGMLVEQAAEAFYIWRNVRPDTANVLAALRRV